ncbi:alpha-amylase family protein [Enterococcus wangshanyuanii]|uniref:Beta-galactosidase trimerisation domain-containing protein n=1 Tax=Enterococcus wangshanyuanii TaxID=2005703 RepID=A0ABQ1NWJ4_9ENTE|nr:alpha-amylase family protein [Enterococcus wangshanyuanii]GGC86201.1 hypothetical protein GCM10011573_14830 [Enterococcus wangshanyuanii]
MSKLASRQIHLDFHTPALPFELGKNFDKKIFQQTLLKAEVNSITLTGRCHHGHIYYQTKLPAKHPQMKKDFLMEQVDACHEIGINAPIYLSVGWDAYAADHHPEWLERKADGSMYGFEDYGQLKPGWKTLCFNTPYLEYLKEQIQDTMQHFGEKLDGLFFDIVWQDDCCCNDCIKKMLDQGYDPESESDRLAFAKETEQYLKTEIHHTIRNLDPDCPIFFNEGNILPSIRPNLEQYSHLEIESLPSGEWGYQHFPTIVRYAKNLGKEYLGMTGKFHKVWADFGSYKNQAALEYETFLALAHGAKCSIGDQMYPDGTLQEATYTLIGAVYDQVKELESYSLNSQAITEIAILHPGIVAASKEKVDLSLAGAVNMLNEAHYQFDIVDQWMDWTPYKLLILPDKLVLTQDLAEMIEGYVEQGGKILASYHSGLIKGERFTQSLGLIFTGEHGTTPMYGYFDSDLFSKLPQGELVMHGQGTIVQAVAANVKGEEAAPLVERKYHHYYSHFQAPVGEKTGNPVVTMNDQTMYYTFPLFEMYKVQGVKAYKELILAGIDHLLKGEKVISSELPTSADVILNHQASEKRLILNLLHYIPERRALTLDTIEDKIPLYNQRVELDLCIIRNKISLDNLIIKQVNQVKSNQSLAFEIVEDKVIFTVPKIVGYEVIAINYE